MAGVSPLSKESPLICYAIRKLNPDVFLHPVWVRFNTELSSSHQEINDLLNEIKSTQQSDPLDTCQLLLLCAACQSCARQYEMALQITRQAHSIAKHAKLICAKIWADWGAAAVCFQWDKYDEATKYLTSLKKELAEQGEWILADFVEIIRQSFSVMDIESQSLHSLARLNPQPNDLLIHALDWLCHWGFAVFQVAEVEFASMSGNVRQDLDRRLGMRTSFSSATPRNLYSHKLVNVFREKFISFSIRHDSKLKELWTSLWKPMFRAAQVRRTEIAPEPTVDFQPPPGELLQDARKYEPESLASFSATSRAKEKASSRGAVIDVIAQMLGTFGMTVQNLQLKLPSSRSLSLLKYLLLHHKLDTPRDMLMDIFWPEADPASARNNLNVAMHGLRQGLRSITDSAIIRFENGAYGLTKNLELWLDVEQFEHCVKEGRRLEAENKLSSAVSEYEIAINLYRGDFLSDTPYESWTILDRERLRVSYLDTLDHLSQIYFNQECYTASVNLCELILTRDICREDIHCRLMQCYSRLRQAPLALRQYQVCVNALQEELDVTPAPTTTHLYQKIRQHQRV